MHIAPVASDIQHINEGQRGHFFDCLLQSLFAALNCKRRTVFLPSVTDQPSAKIPDVVARRLSHKDCEPAVILTDAEGSLVESIAHCEAAEVVTFPQMIGNIGKDSWDCNRAGSCKDCSGLQEVPPAHNRRLLGLQNTACSDPVVQIWAQSDRAVVVQLLVTSRAKRITHVLHFELTTK